ncbi:hypothetical protein ACFL3T_04830, partial [Patescibacteria group bacterium]
SSSTTKLLTFMPNPDYHFRKINNLKREYIKYRLGQGTKSTEGLIKNDVTQPLAEPTFEGSLTI